MCEAPLWRRPSGTWECEPAIVCSPSRTGMLTRVCQGRHCAHTDECNRNHWLVNLGV